MAAHTGRNYFACLVLVTLLAITSAKQGDGNFNIIEKLHKDLLTNYNNQVRPVLNHTETLPLDLNLWLTSFKYEEFKSTFSARGFFRMMWNDPRLKWKPADYEGLDSIHVPSELLWKPDLEVYNTPGLLSKDRLFANNQAYVLSDGSVLFIPLANLISVCKPNPTLFPHDTVDCNIKVGSWTHSIKKILIRAEANATSVDTSDLTSLTQNGWKLEKTTVNVTAKKYDCCPELYQTFGMSFTLKRNAPALTSTTVVPAIGIAILTVAIFLIPPMSGTKIVVGAIDLVLVSIFLIHFNTVIPPSETAPLIVSLFCSTLVMVVVSLVLSCLTFYWTRMPRTSSPPNLIQRFLASRLGLILGAAPIKQESVNNWAEREDLTENKDQVPNGIAGARKTVDKQQLWLNFSVVLHRLALIVYLVVFVVLLQPWLF